MVRSGSARGTSIRCSDDFNVHFRAKQFEFVPNCFLALPFDADRDGEETIDAATDVSAPCNEQVNPHGAPNGSHVLQAEALQFSWSLAAPSGIHRKPH